MYRKKKENLPPIVILVIFSVHLPWSGLFVVFLILSATICVVFYFAMKKILSEAICNNFTIK